MRRLPDDHFANTPAFGWLLVSILFALALGVAGLAGCAESGAVGVDDAEVFVVRIDEKHCAVVTGGGRNSGVDVYECGPGPLPKPVRVW